MRKRTSQDLETYLSSRGIAAEVIKLPVDTLSVKEAARAVGVACDQIVKSLLLNVSGREVLVLGHGLAPVDRGKVAAYFAVAKHRVRLATRSEVEKRTGYAAGAVPPLGHDEGLLILASARLRDYDLLYAGGGATNVLLRITSEDLLTNIDAEEIDLMEHPPEQSA